MEDREGFKVGTLLKDMHRYGVITRVIQSGALETESALIKWRVNYEVVYFDGYVSIIGEESFKRLVKAGIIQIL